MNDQLAGALLFNGCLGVPPKLTDDMDRLSAFGQQSGDVVDIGADAARWSRWILTAYDQMFHSARVSLE